ARILANAIQASRIDLRATLVETSHRLFAEHFVLADLSAGENDRDNSRDCDRSPWPEPHGTLIPSRTMIRATTSSVLALACAIASCLGALAVPSDAQACGGVFVAQPVTETPGSRTIVRDHRIAIA